MVAPELTRVQVNEGGARPSATDAAAQSEFLKVQAVRDPRFHPLVDVTVIALWTREVIDRRDSWPNPVAVALRNVWNILAKCCSHRDKGRL